jgi:DNA repair exonuclease SbcCD ATPase subunit
MNEDRTREELVQIIRPLNSEIFDLRDKLSRLERSRPQDESDVEFLDLERQANQEANAAEINSLQEQLHTALSRVSVLTHELDEARNQNSELRALLREQQELHQPTQMPQFDGAPGATDADHLWSMVRGLELQLKSLQDENSLLANQSRLTESHLNDEIRRLSSQFAESVDSPAPVPGIDIEYVAQLQSEAAFMKRTIQSLSDNVNTQVSSTERLERDLTQSRDRLHEKLRIQSEETAAYRKIVSSIESLLKVDSGSIVRAVQRLSAVESEFHRIVSENAETEKHLSAEILENRRLQQMLETIGPSIETGSVLYKQVFERCLSLQKRYKLSAKEYQGFGQLFQCVLENGNVEDVMAEIEAGFKEELTGTMTQAFLASTDRFNRLEAIMTGILRGTEALAQRIQSLERTQKEFFLRRRRSSISSVGSHGSSRIPVFANAGRLRVPLGARNQAAIDSPRKMPVAWQEPKQKRFG